MGSDSVVVFNEIMYHPDHEPEASGEWIELHNQMAVDVDLSDWKLRGGVDFDFPAGTVVPGGGYLLVAADPDAVANALGPWSGRLDNNGESIRLISNGGRLMNEVEFNDRDPWPAAADGSGASLAKIDEDSASPDPVNWSWSRSIGGSPGMPNFDGNREPGRVLRFSEITGTQEEAAWVELRGFSGSPVDLDDYQLKLLPGGMMMQLEGELAVGGLVVIALPNEWEPVTGNRLFLVNTVTETVVDGVLFSESNRALNKAGKMQTPGMLTPGRPNEIPMAPDIVINEIHYNHPPQYEDPEADPPVAFAEQDEEWIELYNHGSTPVDLSGWAFTDGVRFSFPADTVLDPEAFLVVTGDSEGLAAKYPHIRIFGDWNGNLNNGSDRILLVDAVGNDVDEVTYFDDGRWPLPADGGGATLELRDPRSDNNQAEAWAASDESGKTSWQTFSYRGVAEASAVGPDSQWRELVMGLLDRGEILIDDIRVTEDPDGSAVQLLANSTFQPTIFGGTALREWRLLGNHRLGEAVMDEEQENGRVLRMVATGATGHMHNHIETTLVGSERINNGDEYEVSFRARWVSGCPKLHTRLYFNRLPRVTVLPVPDHIGTPGVVNTASETNIGPVFSTFSHSPPVPDVGQDVEVSVSVSDPDGVGAVTLHWRKDGDEFGGVPMTELGGGRYAGVVPGQDAGEVVQFYVGAEDSLGVSSFRPAAGPDSRALVQFEDGEAATNGLDDFRIIMLDEDVEQLHETINLMGNFRYGATVVSNERTVVYDAGVRLKGSERGRVTTPRLGYNVRFPQDGHFRGVHQTVALDRSEGVGFGQREMLINQYMARAGSVSAEHNDLVKIIAPRNQYTGPAELQLARFGSVMLDGQFSNGSDGDLYEYELIYYPTTADSNGYKRPQPDSVVGTPIRYLGENKEDYRWNYLLKNNRERDAFGALIRWTEVFSMSGDDFAQNVEEVIDVEQWLFGMALAGLSGAGDQYFANSQHNGMFYVRPDDQRVLFFPHDMDFAYNATRSITENRELVKIVAIPKYRRLYLGILNHIVEIAHNDDYLETWGQHFSDLLPGQNFDSHLTFMRSRTASVRSQINRNAPDAAFRITTNLGLDFETEDGVVTLEGTGGYKIRTIEWVEAGVNPDVEWLDDESWRIRLPLDPGENVITLQARDFSGGVGSIFSPLGRATITVTLTNELKPAGAGDLLVSEIMYHPPAPSEAEVAAGVLEGSAFEFIELQNVSDSRVDLSGVRFVSGVEFEFGDLQLAPGEVVVIAADATAFALRYSGAAAPGAVWTSGRLANGGEKIEIAGRTGLTITEFSYDDSGVWPGGADGEGLALVPVRVAGDIDQGDPEQWRALAPSPGEPVVVRRVLAFEEWRAPFFSEAELADALVSGEEADPDLDGLNNWMEFALATDPVAFTGSVLVVEDVTTNALTLRMRRRLPEAGFAQEIESSMDGRNWGPLAVEELSAAQDGSEAEQVVLKAELENSDRFMFLRVKMRR